MHCSARASVLGHCAFKAYERRTRMIFQDEFSDLLLAKVYLLVMCIEDVFC